MMFLAQGVARGLLLLCSMALLCAGPLVVGGIPPSAFHFVNTVPVSDLEPAGWKVAQVIITLNRLSAGVPSTLVCKIEVGVPEVSHKGPILDTVAQSAAATASNAAARLVLVRTELLSAEACHQFRTEMQRLLGNELPGARVTDFLAKGIPQTSFP